MGELKELVTLHFKEVVENLGIGDSCWRGWGRSKKGYGLWGDKTLLEVSNRRGALMNRNIQMEV